MPPKSSTRKRKTRAGSVETSPTQSKRVTKRPATRKARNVKAVIDTDDDEDSSALSEPEDSDFDAQDEEEEEEEEEEKKPTPAADGPQSWEIDLPRARKAGKTPYEPDQIHPNTFLFLQDLKANNRRDWLKLHDEDFRNAQRDFEAFVDELSLRIIELDPTIPELPKKDLIMRIYRDIRFSPDPTPYKTHFSVAWSRTGKKGPYAAYYLQIQPGNQSFVGGGLWQPAAAPLALLRNAIDNAPSDLKAALTTPIVRDEFFAEAASAEEESIMQAFLTQNGENALKTKPRGYEADHEEIELLRLRNFTLGKKLKDADVLGEEGMENIVSAMRGLVPWVTYLNSIVMPDRRRP